MATTVLAVILGIILVMSIHPGTPGKSDEEITKVLLQCATRQDIN
jgi:hypothetical protein